MGELDHYFEKNNCSQGIDKEYDLFMEHVVCGESELLFLDTYLCEMFARTVN